MDNVYLVCQAKRTSGTWSKGVVIKDAENLDNREEALQTYHSYLGAYGYNHEANTDYVFCEIVNANGEIIMLETWEKRAEEEPEPEPEE